ncbi:hypothetical protein V5799_031041 [Amblyomma americanum]|uniref:Uncharacterized protein n=1 Tax=Amblyomma americanum TaxID=6943 RepID=A0AAQ4ELK5_AMBAM
MDHQPSTQTLGAVGIFSAAVGISTMFPVPLLYSNMAIGLAGTIYTALGGLRSVVWADCIQALVMLASPLIIIGKIIYDSGSVDPPLRPLSDFNVTHSMLRTEFDLTSDENVWSGLAGTLPFCLVRVGFDQMPVQRFMAAKTLRQARWHLDEEANENDGLKTSCAFCDDKHPGAELATLHEARELLKRSGDTRADCAT